MMPTESEAMHLAHFWSRNGEAINMSGPGVRDAASYARLIEHHWVIPTGNADAEFVLSTAGLEALKRFFASF